MFQLHLTQFYVAVAALTTLVSGIPTPDAQVSGQNNCSYITHGESTFAEVPFTYRPFAAQSLNECIEFCRKDTYCVAARYDKNARKKNTCVAQTQPHYSGVPIKAKPGVIFIQIIKNSCNNKAAIPYGLHCQPRILIDKHGCEYNITCNESIVDDHHTRQVIGQFNTVEECLREMVSAYGKRKSDNPSSSIGMTYTHDGFCRVPLVRHYKSLATEKTLHAETAYIVEGSCKKIAANP